MASKEGHKEMIESLLSAGADVNRYVCDIYDCHVFYIFVTDDGVLTLMFGFVLFHIGWNCPHRGFSEWPQRGG